MQGGYKGHVLSKIYTYKLFARFKRQEITIEGRLRLGRPSSAGNEDFISKIRDLIREDQHGIVSQL